MGQGTFTDNQWLAINTEGCDLLVAAAAGSGKTAVLVERIIHIITDETKPVNIDQLLVVTFTKAAAGEMKQRIGDALTKQLEKQPNNVHLQNQLTLLNRADIKTIHAFCLQVIREHYYLLGIDPQSRTADPPESRLLQQETLDNLFEQLYETEDNAFFLELVERFSESAGDRNLKKLILKLYTFLLGCQNPKEWLIEKTAELKQLSIFGFETASWMPALQKAIQDKAKFALYLIERAKEIAAFDADFEKYFNTLQMDAEGIQEFLFKLKDGYISAYGGINALTFSKLPPYRGDNKEMAEEIKRMRNLAKDTVGKIIEKYYPCAPKVSQQHIDKLWPIADALCHVTLLFMEQFQQIKRDKQILDFGDYEHYCLELLVEPQSTLFNVIPTAVASNISNQYIEILIDEYQDSNVIQEMLLSSISRSSVGQNNRFLVGDVKQSIYGFRLAAPEIFMQKYLSFPSLSEPQALSEETKKSLANKIVLSHNFRSRANVLEGINFLFCQMMSPEVGGLVYDNEAALTPAMPFPQCEGLCGGANEILLVDLKKQETDDDDTIDDFVRQELEAKLIAKRIKALFQEGFLVLDKTTGEYRPLAFGDIAILLRSLTSWNGIFDRIFTEEEIPFYAETATSYYDVPEVTMALQYLRLIDNPMQDIPLMSVLHNSIYGFSADDLMAIRLASREFANPSPTFFDACENYMVGCAEGDISLDQELGVKIEAFMKDLEAWRDYAVEHAISELLWYLYDNTGYYDQIGVQAGGRLRQSNLRLLIEKAEQYEKNNHKGLFHFIKYVEQIKKAGADDAGSAKEAEGGNLVQIMTIHKSKGLEFPIVFVSDLGKDFNKMDVRSDVLLHQDLGIAFDDMDILNRVRFRTIVKSALAEQIINQNISEEMRVLYVALTRAKEKLILTGSVKGFWEQNTMWQMIAEAKTAELPTFFLARANCYFDWIFPAFLRHKESNSIWQYSDKTPPYFGDKLMGMHSLWNFQYYEREEISKLITIRKNNASVFHDSFAGWDTSKNYSGYKQEIYDRLSWQYPYEISSKLPSKISISEIKRRQFDTEETISFFPPLKLQSVNEESQAILSPTEIGVAVHTFLERLDFKRSYTKVELAKQLTTMQNDGWLTPEEAVAVNMNEIFAFFESDLASRMRASQKIYKEQAFAMTMTPQELHFSGWEVTDIEENILINGIIDCYFYENDNIILLDYKTDRISSNREDLLKQRYSLQLSLYKQALERITGKKVSQTYLYSLALSKAIEI